MALRRGVRDWLLAKDADPSVRLRVLRDVLGRPEHDPAILRAQKEIGRKGWAAKILAEQHPKGHWATPGTSARELYRPKYVATNWRLLVLAELGMTKKNPRVAKGMELLVRKRFLEAGEIGGRGGGGWVTREGGGGLLRVGVPNPPAPEAPAGLLL